MKVLIVGSSISGGLYRAMKSGLFQSDAFNPSFYVISGGTGPYLKVTDGFMQLVMKIDAYPPYSVPDGIDKLPLDHWDVIVISALGLVDSGFGAIDPIKLEAVVAEYDPIVEPDGPPLVSEACMAELVALGLRQQLGVRFLQQLGKTFKGRIIVQPFPLPSIALMDRDDWRFGARYRDRLGAHHFLCRTRDQAIAALCAEAGAELLDLPDPSWRSDGFTPLELSKAADCLHPTEAYGALVLQQIADRIGAVG